MSFESLESVESLIKFVDEAAESIKETLQEASSSATPSPHHILNTTARKIGQHPTAKKRHRAGYCLNTSDRKRKRNFFTTEFVPERPSWTTFTGQAHSNHDVVSRRDCVSDTTNHHSTSHSSSPSLECDPSKAWIARPTPAKYESYFCDGYVFSMGCSDQSWGRTCLPFTQYQNDEWHDTQESVRSSCMFSKASQTPYYSMQHSQKFYYHQQTPATAASFPHYNLQWLQPAYYSFA